jgi:hypothetical protein
MESMICWYCEKRPFNPEDSLKVILRRNISTTINVQSQTTYNRETVLVPRCHECAEVHKKLEKFGSGWALFVGIIPMVIAIIATIVTFFGGPVKDWSISIIFFIIGAGLMGYGYIDILKNKKKESEKNKLLAEEMKTIGIIRPNKREGLNHPRVRELMAQGFKTIEPSDIM